MARKKLILRHMRKQLKVVRSVLKLIRLQLPVMKENVLGQYGTVVPTGVIMAIVCQVHVPAATVSARFAVAGIFWTIR